MSSSLYFVLLVLLSPQFPSDSTPLSAHENIAGAYEMATKSEAELIIAPLLPNPNCFVAEVKLNKHVVKGEAMIICPKPGGGFSWTNRKGTTGTIELLSNGDLVAVVSGPNGKRTT